MDPTWSYIETFVVFVSLEHLCDRILPLNAFETIFYVTRGLKELIENVYFRMPIELLIS